MTFSLVCCAQSAWTIKSPAKHPTTAARMPYPLPNLIFAPRPYLQKAGPPNKCQTNNLPLFGSVFAAMSWLAEGTLQSPIAYLISKAISAGHARQAPQEGEPPWTASPVLQQSS